LVNLATSALNYAVASLNDLFSTALSWTRKADASSIALKSAVNFPYSDVNSAIDKMIDPIFYFAFIASTYDAYSYSANFY